jgi:hypothetical protein
MKGKRMIRSVKYAAFALLLSIALTISACGGSNETDPAIATAVALTVAAQNAQATPATPLPSPTPTLPLAPTLTPFATPPQPTLPSSASKYAACVKANYVGQTIPDYTIMKPGAQFTQTWQILNSSSCTWDTTYKIIFWDGNLMGGALEYNFPQVAGPGKVVDVPLVLTAPQEDGMYTSFWMFKAPDGTIFGVGEYNQPFFVVIEVSSSSKPNYTITNVEYEIVREPAVGCPANVWFTVYATVTTNGPLEFAYYWTQSDGNNSSPKTVEIEAAGSKRFERSWSFGLAANRGEKWIRFNIAAPFEKEYPKAVFSYICP